MDGLHRRMDTDENCDLGRVSSWGIFLRTGEKGKMWGRGMLGYIQKVRHLLSECSRRNEREEIVK